jgi:membrane-associated phospholipid phosphatase
MDSSSPAASISQPADLPPGRAWTHRVVLFFAAALAVLAFLALGVVVPLAVWARDTRLPSDLERLIRLAEVFGFGGTAALIAVTAGVLDGRSCLVSLRLLASGLGAGLVADGVKLLVARERPSHAALDTLTALDTFSTWLPALNREALSTAYGHAWQSFPSAHSATAAGLAVGLALLYPRARWLFALFAALACFQRIDAQAHFLSDCLVGAAIGCVVAMLAARLPCGVR